MVSEHGVIIRAVVPWDREGTQNDQSEAIKERGCHSAPPQGRRNTSNFDLQPSGQAAGGRPELGMSFQVALRTRRALVPLMVSQV